MDVAEVADAEVWHAIGDAFNNGRGTERNRDEARRWFERGAEVGHTRSMVRLGGILWHPQTPLSHECAIAWFRKAADLGDPDGMVWLGFSYREGRGVRCDATEAAQWFIKAVGAGDSHAMIYAGRMYARELAQPAQALQWFHRAADAGLSESHIHLAMLYDDRKSPIHNSAEAVKWYLAVVEGTGGHKARAMLALARHSRDGIGTERGRQIAQNWLLRLLDVVPKKSAAHREASGLLEQIRGDLL
jgi:TPR repeat protein